MENLNYNIFLDDVREPKNAYDYTKNQDYLKKDWIVVRNYNELVQTLKELEEVNGRVQIISFDHDLAPEHYAPEDKWQTQYAEWEKGQNFVEKTGLDCAKYFTDWLDRVNTAAPLRWLVHSMNPVGRERIEQHISDWIDGQ